MGNSLTFGPLKTLRLLWGETNVDIILLQYASLAHSTMVENGYALCFSMEKSSQDNSSLAQAAVGGALSPAVQVFSL